ncbi:MAG TPA: RDD family protein [Actinomycetota bacterium]|nr:RDD family protein [Actinomycetota bacterium]
MAVRQLHYCTHCGTPIVGNHNPGATADRGSGGNMGRDGGRDARVNFCPSCGHRLYRATAVIPRRPPLRVAAPAAVAPPLAKAPFERRLAAAGVDLLLAGVAALVAWALGAEISVIVNAGAPHGSMLAWVLVVLVLAGYQPLFWARAGRTPGMQLLGLRLVSAEGTPVSAGRALARAGAMVLSAAAVGLGFTGAWRDPSGRTWHDRLAGTAVVGPPQP